MPSEMTSRPTISDALRCSRKNATDINSPTTGTPSMAVDMLVLDSQVLASIPGVANIRSSFALKQVRYKTALPLPAGGVEIKR